MTGIANPVIGEFSGDVITPQSPGYNEARTLWNAMIDRKPAVILRPRSAADVAAAVRYAGQQGLPVAVKCGGHSAPGYSVCDDGVVIDLSLMQQVTVDPVARTARAQGGALLQVLDAATQRHGLAVPAGAISHTGMGGLVLGGGFGHLMRKWGLSVDSVTGMEVVLADGSVVWADDDHYADLFWALRGGSGNFGVVTEFAFRCHPVGPLYATAHVFELAAAHDVMRAFRAHMAQDAPDELEWVSFFRSGPDFSWIPRRLVGAPVLMMPLIWAGDARPPRRHVAGEHHRPLGRRQRGCPQHRLGTCGLRADGAAPGRRRLRELCRRRRDRRRPRRVRRHLGPARRR